MAVTVAIQAGGQSRRMGQDKALALLGGRPLIAHVLDAVRPLADELIITTRRPDAYATADIDLHDVRLVEDSLQHRGALAGLYTAFAAATQPHVLVVACDMPLVQRPLLAHLLTLLDTPCDAVVPVWDGHDQPLLAVYRRDVCLPAVTAALEMGRERADSFFAAVRVRRVSAAECATFDPDGISFTNVNTPADLSRLHRRN